MSNFVYILLIAANGWSMVNCLTEGNYVLACSFAFLLGWFASGPFLLHKYRR